MRRTLFVVAAIVATLCASAPSWAQDAAPTSLALRWNDPTFQQRAIALLKVQDDGTVRVSDWLAARRLFGPDLSWAMNDLEQWNQKVRGGVESGFRNREELASHAIVLNDNWLAAAKNEPRPDAVFASTAPYCRGGPIGRCVSNTCCCGGWWFFCTQLCTPCRTK